MSFPVGDESARTLGVLDVDRWKALFNVKNTRTHMHTSWYTPAVTHTLARLITLRTSVASDQLRLTRAAAGRQHAARNTQHAGDASRQEAELNRGEPCSPTAERNIVDPGTAVQDTYS